jgi:hypothetical protein
MAHRPVRYDSALVPKQKDLQRRQRQLYCRDIDAQLLRPTNKHLEVCHDLRSDPGDHDGIGLFYMVDVQLNCTRHLANMLMSATRNIMAS